MAGDDRESTDHLARLERLTHEVTRYGFFEALRWLECAFPDQPRFGYALRPDREQVRIGQSPSMSFATSSLDSLQRSPDGKSWRLQTFCFGMFGPNGALPLSLTEFAYERRHLKGDVTWSRFVDLFHHRLATLFYRAWADAQPVVQADRPDQDRFAFYVGCLMGIGPEAFRHRDAMPDHAKLHQAGHLACQTRHADGLASILTSFFRLPARVEEFIGRWTEIPAECRLVLGQSPHTGKLGDNALIGARMWDRHQNIRVELGPLNWAEYQRLLPHGSSLARLAAVVRNYLGFELRWDARLILRRSEVPSLTLGRQGHLGWTTWLAHPGRERDADDLVLSRALENC